MTPYPASNRPFPIIALAIGLALLGGACSSASVSSPAPDFGQVVPVEGSGSYVDISPSELDRMLSTEEFFFVNVHIPYEGEIPGTDAMIPYDQVREELEQFPQDRDAKIVLYCRSGSMSAIAARALVEEGFTNIFNLDGGFRAWESQGFTFDR